MMGIIQEKGKIYWKKNNIAYVMFLIGQERIESSSQVIDLASKEE